jgi:hypothetical protein
MKINAIIAAILGIICVGLFTTLLLMNCISEIIYASLLVSFALVCITLLVLPRLKELDLKNLRLILVEIRQVKAEVEEVKEEVAAMYGGIENLRKQPLVLDDAKMKELGLSGGHLVTSSAVMRYPAGCIKRERERLAKIFIREKTPERIATAILDGSLDDKVFKWNGPETPLDAEPKSVEARETEKAEETEQKT